MNTHTATTSFRRRGNVVGSFDRRSIAAAIGRRSIAATAVLLLLTANGASAATKFQTNLVPSVPDCLSFLGTCINVEGSCGFDNNECAGGTIAVLGVSLLSPSTGSCPGDNSAAAIAARMNNGVCENTQVPLTIVRAVGGILAP